MDQPYSMWADWLSKFHSSPELIQGLWLVAVPLTLLGITWLVMRGVGDLFRLLRGERLSRRERRHWRGHLIYGVYQDGEGRWMVCWHGRAPEAADWTNPPPELIGRGTVVQGVFRRPEG